MLGCYYFVNMWTAETFPSKALLQKNSGNSKYKRVM